MPQAALPPSAGGWNTRDGIATMAPEFAPLCDNWIVEGGALRVRPGYSIWATGLDGGVHSLLPWNGATPKVFAAAGDKIYDVTTSGPVGAPAVSGLSSQPLHAVQMNAAGGLFLFACNGQDAPQIYNGTSWSAWSGTGVPSPPTWALPFKSRLFVGRADKMGFWYGGAGAIGGGFTEFTLNGVALRGGGICAATSLTIDGGDGPDDVIVFLTTQGEAIVYAGYDPSNVATWSLVGRWQLPPPVCASPRCVVRVGSDAWILTESGIVPLASLRAGVAVEATLDEIGPLRRIEPTWRAWRADADRRARPGWAIAHCARAGWTIVTVPWVDNAWQHVVVSERGALSRWLWVPARVWAEALGGRIFFGTADGRVGLFGETTEDAGAPILADAMTAFYLLKAPSRVKRAQLAQVVMRDTSNASVSARVLTDWSTPPSIADERGAFPPPLPPPTPAGGSFVWDQSLWDVATWGGDEQQATRAWRAGAVIGHALAVRCRVVSHQCRPAWLGSLIVFEVGHAVR